MGNEPLSMNTPANATALKEIPRSERMKKCARCGGKQLLSNFAKHSTSSDGHASYCNGCRNKLGERRRKQNLAYKLRHHIHSRIIKYKYEKGIPKGLVTDLEKYLGYSMFQLKKYLSNDLVTREGITLRDSFGRGYHLDHIYPLSRFNIQNIGDEEFRKCWAMTNLRMIPAEDNLSKGAKVLDDC